MESQSEDVPQIAMDVLKYDDDQKIPIIRKLSDKTESESGIESDFKKKDQIFRHDTEEDIEEISETEISSASFVGSEFSESKTSESEKADIERKESNSSSAVQSQDLDSKQDLSDDISMESKATDIDKGAISPQTESSEATPSDAAAESNEVLQEGSSMDIIKSRSPDSKSRLVDALVSYKHIAGVKLLKKSDEERIVCISDPVESSQKSVDTGLLRPTFKASGIKVKSVDDSEGLNQIQPDEETDDSDSDMSCTTPWKTQKLLLYTTCIVGSIPTIVIIVWIAYLIYWKYAYSQIKENRNETEELEFNTTELYSEVTLD